MAVTTNKGAYLPQVSGDDGTWGTLLNTTTFPVFDNNLGGITSISLSNSDYVLSSAESQTAILRIIGTLSANVQVTTVCKGFTIIDNVTTGAFTVSFTNGVGTPIVIPQGVPSLVITDATNGARRVGDSFATGTSTIFYQATAPIGWTKSTASHDFAIQVVTDGNGGTTGGSTAFSSVFTARTITIANLPAHAHGVNDPGHHHSAFITAGSGNIAVGTNFSANTAINTSDSTTGITIQNTGSGTAMDFDVKMIRCIVGVKA